MRLAPQLGVGLGHTARVRASPSLPRRRLSAPSRRSVPPRRTTTGASGRPPAPAQRSAPPTGVKKWPRHPSGVQRHPGCAPGVRPRSEKPVSRGPAGGGRGSMAASSPPAVPERQAPRQAGERQRHDARSVRANLRAGPRSVRIRALRRGGVSSLHFQHLKPRHQGMKERTSRASSTARVRESHHSPSPTSLEDHDVMRRAVVAATEARNMGAPRNMWMLRGIRGNGAARGPGSTSARYTGSTRHRSSLRAKTRTYAAGNEAITCGGAVAFWTRRKFSRNLLTAPRQRRGNIRRVDAIALLVLEGRSDSARRPWPPIPALKKLGEVLPIPRARRLLSRIKSPTARHGARQVVPAEAVLRPRKRGLLRTRRPNYIRLGGCNPG